MRFEWLEKLFLNAEKEEYKQIAKDLEIARNGKKWSEKEIEDLIKL
jgi:hypothetical protein